MDLEICLEMWNGQRFSTLVLAQKRRDMGVFFSSLLDSLFGSKEQRILVLGLDNAGKTTILCCILCTPLRNRQTPA